MIATYMRCFLIFRSSRPTSCMIGRPTSTKVPSPLRSESVDCAFAYVPSECVDSFIAKYHNKYSCSGVAAFFPSHG